MHEILWTNHCLLGAKCCTRRFCGRVNKVGYPRPDDYKIRPRNGPLQLLKPKVLGLSPGP